MRFAPETIYSLGEIEFNNVTVRGIVHATSGEFTGVVNATSFSGSGLEILPKYESGVPIGIKLNHDTDGPVGWISPRGNEATGTGTGRAMEVGGYDDVLLNAFGSATVGAIKAFGYFDMWHGASDYWRWDPGFNGPTSELQLSKNTTVLYKFADDGRAYADLGWSTFSPTPPKPAAEMTLRDWLDWAAEDATKDVKPYDGIPTADHPEVKRIAAELNVSAEEVAALESEKYQKDVAKISIGFGMALKMVVEAATASASWGDFRKKLTAL